MRCSENIVESRERLIKSYILKCAIIQFVFAIGSCIAFHEQFLNLINDEILGLTLLAFAIWNVIGIAFYSFFIPSNKIAHDMQKVLILILYFAPTISLLTFGPMLNTSQTFYSPQSIECFREEPKAKETVHMFFARHPITRGEPLTTKNTIVLAVDSQKNVGGIIATKSNHFGDSTNKDSMLLRKCIYPIEAGSPIRDSDIEPHY